MLLSPSPTAASDPTTLLDRAQLSVAVEAAIRERVIEQFVQQRRYSTSISEHFGPLTDPRKAGMIEHKLLDIITIAVCAVICGADDWVKVELFGKAKYDWLKTSLALPHGIPSHDTFGRVFAALSGRELQGCFANWMQAMVRLGQGEVIAIDGKTLRRSYDRRSNKAAIHMVSAWAQANRVVLGQVKTEAKSNEITAIPELLKLLAIRGCVVTIDAMGCQKAIAAQIIDRGGDYVLALKGNQGLIHQDVADYFTYAQARGFKGVAHAYHETLDADHGRIEIRRYWTVDALDWLADQAKWKGLNMIGLVESERHIGEEVSVEQRYYLASLDNNAQRFAHAVRGHWSIENTLHWSLDVSFKEDACRLRKGQGAENFAVLRHIALSLLQQEQTEPVGIESKRFKAALDQQYLLKVLIAQKN
jgi:predicted transposase YbfD/YdcC